MARGIPKLSVVGHRNNTTALGNEFAESRVSQELWAGRAVRVAVSGLVSAVMRTVSSAVSLLPEGPLS